MRLLRAGCFGTDEAVEPMSAWKWGQVVELSALHHTTALIYDGYRRCSDQFFLKMPQRLVTIMENGAKAAEQAYAETVAVALQLHERLSLQQCRPILTGALSYSVNYPVAAHCHAPRIHVFFPYETQGKKADDWADYTCGNLRFDDKHTTAYEWLGASIMHHHRLLQLNNRLLGHGFQGVLEQELRESRTHTILLGNQQLETLSPTLALFHLLFRLSQDLLSKGITLPDLLHLGILLRQTGDRVDFVKLQSWSDRLKMQRMLTLIGQLMIDLLTFEQDELPFATFDQSFDTQRIVQEILLSQADADHRMTFSQGNNSIFVHAGNKRAVMWHVRRSARFMKYYPSESLASFFSSFARSITDIEE